MNLIIFNRSLVKVKNAAFCRRRGAAEFCWHTIALLEVTKKFLNNFSVWWHIWMRKHHSLSIYGAMDFTPSQIGVTPCHLWSILANSPSPQSDVINGQLAHTVTISICWNIKLTFLEGLNGKFHKTRLFSFILRNSRNKKFWTLGTF